MKIFQPERSLVLADCHPELARAELFRRPAGFGPGCMSVEEATFVFSLVRLIKPLRALETGCEGGLTTCAIAAALRDNGLGHLDTVEIDPNWKDHADANLAAMGLTMNATIHLSDSLAFISSFASIGVDSRFDFALLDSSISTRLQEFDALMERGYLRPGAFVVLHDTNPVHPMRQGCELFPDFLASKPYAHRARLLHLPSPRGLTLIEIL